MSYITENEDATRILAKAIVPPHLLEFVGLMPTHERILAIEGEDCSYSVRDSDGTIARIVRNRRPTGRLTLTGNDRHVLGYLQGTAQAQTVLGIRDAIGLSESVIRTSLDRLVDEKHITVVRVGGQNIHRIKGADE